MTPKAPAAATPDGTPAISDDTLFVWDFDWTVINCNSDEYIPAQFLGNQDTADGFRELYSQGLDWHSCVEIMVGRAIDEKGATPDSILESAKKMPFLTQVRGAIEDIATGKDGSIGQMILSDGNTLFISAFLEANGMADSFSHGIISNAGTFDGPGNRLRVVHQSAKYGGHSCGRCTHTPNLCKTQALTDKLTQLVGSGQRSQRPRIAYIGDGENDACPALNVLKEGDVFLARAGFRRLEANARSGPETDEEAKDISNGRKCTPFAILNVLQEAEESGDVPTARVMQWETGSELRSLVKECLGVFTSD